MDADTPIRVSICDRCGHTITDADILCVNGGGQVDECIYCPPVVGGLDGIDLNDAETPPDRSILE